MRNRILRRADRPRFPPEQGNLVRHSREIISTQQGIISREQGIRRRPTISESTRPLGSTRHCIPSEAKPSAVPPPPARRFGGASSADAANPRDRFYTTGLGNTSADPLVDRGMASLARTGRPWKWQRSEPIAPSRVISFWASPKSELIPLSSRINSAVNPLLIRCYGGRVSPVRAEFIAGSRRGERGFATISLPRGFCSRRGGRRSAMPSQFENPMMISLFENNNMCHDYFSHSERLRMLIKRRMASSEWRMGIAERTIRHSLLERRRDETRGRRRRPRPIGRDARLPLVERARS